MELGFKVFEHAAALIGRSPGEVSRDPELLFQAHAASYRLYGQEPLIAAIDHYNLAPEAYGAAVAQPAGNGSPAIETPLLTSAEDILRLPLFDPALAGRFPLVCAVASRLAREFPAALVAVPVDGPFSIASALIGFDQLLCEVVENPVGVRAALRHLAAGQVRLAEHVRSMDLSVAFAESAAGPPLLSSTLFHEVEMPVLQDLLSAIGRIVGHPVACLMGGDTVKILDDLVATDSPALVCPFETDQAAFVEKLKARPGIRVRVNLHAGIVARGSWAELKAEADRALACAAGRPNTVLGAGVLPYETKTENVFRLRDYLAAFEPQS